MALLAKAPLSQAWANRWFQHALRGTPIPVYGDGMNVRDWLYVRDHAEALWQVVTRGALGETYNIGGHNEWANLRIVELICDLIDEMAPHLGGQSRKLITFVKDRPGHDRVALREVHGAAGDPGDVISQGHQPVHAPEGESRNNELDEHPTSSQRARSCRPSTRP